MIIGKRLKHLRISANFNQSEIATILNVSQRTISNWENDVAQPSYELTKKMAIIYNVSVDYLYSNDTKTLEFINNKRIEVAENIKSNKNDYLTFTAKNLVLKINNIRQKPNIQNEDFAEIIKLNIEINDLIAEHYENAIVKIEPERNNDQDIQRMLEKQIEQIKNDVLLNSIK